VGVWLPAALVFLAGLAFRRRPAGKAVESQ